MPRFFESKIDEDKHFISGENARHITKSLRMKLGEKITLCDDFAVEYDCVICEITADGLFVDVLSKKTSENESSCKIRLYQCTPKGDKLDYITQKATELGVYEINLVNSKNCVAKIDDKIDKKLSRLQKIALEAAKQSGRAYIPKISGLLSFSDAAQKATGLKLFFYEGKAGGLKEILSGYTGDISVFIGPEGGFSENEVKLALEQGWKIVSLGNRILRTETASLAAISIIEYETGNM